MMRPLTAANTAALTVICCVSLFLNPRQAWPAEPAGETVTYEELLAQAMTSSSTVRDIDSAFASGLADALQIGLLPNPELEVEAALPFAYPADRGGNPFAVSFSQPLRTSYFGLRKAVGEYIKKTTEEDKQIALVEFNQKVRLMYLRAWLLDQRRGHLELARQRASTVSSELNRIVRAGGLGEAEAKLFAAEAGKLEAELTGIRAALDAVRGELVALTGVNLDQRRFKEPPRFETSSLDALIEAASEGALPVQRRAQIKQKLAHRYSELAQKDAAPRFAPRLLYEHSEENVNYAGIGFSMELPFFDRNQPERIKRQAELSAAAAKMNYLHSAVFREQLRLFLHSYHATNSQITTYQKRVIPSLEQALTSFERQFRAGQGMVLQIWQTQNELVNAQSRVTELFIEAHEKLAELSVMLGQAI